MARFLPCSAAFRIVVAWSDCAQVWTCELADRIVGDLVASGAGLFPDTEVEALIRAIDEVEDQARRYPELARAEGHRPSSGQLRVARAPCRDLAA